ITIGSPPAPTMTLDKTALTFGAANTGAALATMTTGQTVRMTQSGAGTVTWTASTNQPWLKVGPASGTGTAALTVEVVSVSGLPMTGAINGSVTIALTGAGKSAGPIAVTLRLYPNGTTVGPFGVIDTPLNYATGVTGAVPFTGWGLDDEEVA